MAFDGWLCSHSAILGGKVWNLRYLRCAQPPWNAWSLGWACFNCRVAAIANDTDYNIEGNYLAVFPYDEDPATQAGYQAAFLLITLAVSIITGLLTGEFAKMISGSLQPRVYKDDKFFEEAFR